MPITNTLSIFATEQAILGSQKRDVKYGTTDVVLNMGVKIDQNNEIELDASQPNKSGLIHQGVEAIFTGTEIYDINGYTGFIYAKSTIVDGISAGDTPTITTEIIQSVSFPSDVESPPNYELHTKLFTLDAGKVNVEFKNDANIIAKRFEGLNFEIGETITIPNFIGIHPINLGYKGVAIVLDDNTILNWPFFTDFGTWHFTAQRPTYTGTPNSGFLYGYRLSYDINTGEITFDQANAFSVSSTGDVNSVTRPLITEVIFTK